MTAPSEHSPSLRAKANRIKGLRCKNLIVVLEDPDNVKNVGTVIRNVNVLGADKLYIVSRRPEIPTDWQHMRGERQLNRTSASGVKWTFVKIFETTEACLTHLRDNNFVSAVTSPYLKGRENVVLHEADYTKYKKLAVWFGNERFGLSQKAIEHSSLCINIPMYGIIESLNLGTASGIVLYEIGKQRRAHQVKRSEKIKAKKEARTEA